MFDSADWRLSNRAAVRAAVLGLALLASLAAARAPAAESVEMEVVPAGDELFASGAPAPDSQPMAPAPGQCLVMGRYSRLKIDDLSQITIQAPDGRQVPLVVESSSIFREFGHIAELRFCFQVSRAEAEPGMAGFKLKWGPDVKAANTQVERLALDAAQRDLYRGLRVRVAERFASFTAIADNTAEYHFLWYLLPMALVFALLIAGKVRARGPSDSTT